MKQVVSKGATSQSLYLFIRDSSSTTGAGLTGLAYNTGSLVASYVRPRAARTAITLITMTVTGAYSSGGFVEVDATNMPGVYRLDVPDAVFATGVDTAVVMLKGATNMEPVVVEVQLTAANLQDGVRGGLTALPNAAAEAAGGLYTRGSGAGQINQPANGRVDVNLVAAAADTLTASALATDAVTEIVTAVWAAAARTLTAGTNIVLAKGTGITGLNDLDAAAFRAAAGLSSANLDTQLAAIAGYIDTEVAAIKTVTDHLATALELDGAVYRFTANALETAPTGSGGGGGLDAAGVRAAIGLTSANLETLLAALQADTDNIQTRIPAALVAGRLDVYVGAMANNSMTAAAAATDLVTKLQAGLSTASALATLASAVAAIATKTDALPSDPADQSLIIDAANAIMARLGAPVGASLSADLAGMADAVWDEPVDGAVTARQSLRLSNSAAAGKAAGMASNTVTLRDLADTKDRVTATVDANGNRTAVARDLT